MSKNIVVFSDGTGQEGGAKQDLGTGANTNVYKTFQMAESRSDRQICFYARGLGTGARKISSIVSSATGAGISRDIREGYRFIYDNYSDGDKIFLFGFSRGAATARSLAGFIDLFGILPDSRPDLIKKAYAIYKINDETKRLQRADDFVQNYGNLWCDVHFVGVWDTVSALGVPSRTLSVLLDKLPFGRHTFHDLKLSKRVRHARHAMAIDDVRKTFHPTPWREDLEGDEQTRWQQGFEGDEQLLWRKNLVGKVQTLKQVWFAGMHTDVGGGYKEHGLSDIPFDWMIREAIEQGFRVYAAHEVESHPSQLDLMHDSRLGAASLFSRAERTWPPKEWPALTPVPRPTVHQSVVERKKNGRVPVEQEGGKRKDEPYDPWILRKCTCGDSESKCEAHDTEPLRNDAEKLTKVLVELADLVKDLNPAEGHGVPDELQARLDVELRIAHALIPRGTPAEDEEDKRKKLSPLERKQVARRSRGDYRRDLFTRSTRLMESIEALNAKLKTKAPSGKEVGRLKEEVINKAEKQYDYYLERLLARNLRQISNKSSV